MAAAGLEGADAEADAAAAGLLGFLGSAAAAAADPLPPSFLASSHGVTQARAEAWRALSSDSAEALFFFGWGKDGRISEAGNFFRAEEEEEVELKRTTADLKKDDRRSKTPTFESSQVVFKAFACLDFGR